MSRNRKIELELATFSQSLIDCIKYHQDLMHQQTFPSPRWREDPVGFFRDVLCVEPWERQREILNACVTQDKIAVRSGRRVGKSVTISGLALWRWASFENGRCLLTSATKDQLDLQLWAEISKMYYQAGVCVQCRRDDPERPAPCPHSGKLIGYINQTSKGGLKSPDPAHLRRINGKTAKKPSALAGFGHPDFITLIDEIEGLPASVIEMLVGNLASGGVLAAFGNPLDPRGYFASCFKPNSTWHQIKISSRETPNYQSGQMLIPGLSTRRFVDEVVREHGEGSAYVMSMIDGDFPTVDTAGAPISLAKIKEAQARNATAPEDGRLTLGCDIASSSADGRNDDTVITLIRGHRMLCAQHVLANYRESEVVDKITGLVEEYRTHGEKPLVVVDAAGVGFKVAEALQRFLDREGPLFEILRYRANERALFDTKLVHNRRDESFSQLIRYLDSGGGLIRSEDLEVQLPLHQWIVRHDGLATLTDKPKIRRQAGRSPDQSDSLMLACLQLGTGYGTPMGKPTKTAAPTYSRFGGGGGSRYDQQRRRRG